MGLPMVKIDDLPASAFPDKPLESGKCLECGVVERCSHSWFCSDECEESYIKRYNATGFGKGLPCGPNVTRSDNKMSRLACALSRMGFGDGDRDVLVEFVDRAQNSQVVQEV